MVSWNVPILLDYLDFSFHTIKSTSPLCGTTHTANQGKSKGVRGPKKNQGKERAECKWKLSFYSPGHREGEKRNNSKSVIFLAFEKCRVKSDNPLTAKEKISRPGNLTFYSPGPQGGYLGGSRPMLPCVTFCPLIT